MDAAPPAAAPGALPVSMPSSLVVTASRRVSSAENLSSISLDRGPRECARLGRGEKCDESRGEACATLMKPKDGRCGGGHRPDPRPPPKEIAASHELHCTHGRLDRLTAYYAFTPMSQSSPVTRRIPPHPSHVTAFRPSETRDGDESQEGLHAAATARGRRIHHQGQCVRHARSAAMRAQPRPTNDRSSLVCVRSPFRFSRHRCRPLPDLA